jgi:predicted lipoprotein with Yx(FWY)xxD motif
MKKTVILAALVIIVFACSIAFAGQLSVQSKDGVGSFLTDAKGMTLYTFKKDSAGKSACEGDCLAKWPAFYDKKIKAPKGVDKKDFGVITRTDNKKKQTTFRGMPLYYFAKDQKKGDTNGQGLINAWYVVDPAAVKP